MRNIIMKRFAALFVALVMVLSLCSITAWAEGATSPEAQWGLATGENSDQTPTEWVGSGALDEAMTYANSLAFGTAYILLLSDVKTSAPLEFVSGKTTILDLNGKTIDRGLTEATTDGNVITISGGNLTLCDTSETASGKITGGYKSNGFDGYLSGGVLVSDGTFTMNGGTISGNTASNGGGVCVCRSNGFFTMNGGSISGNTAEYNGGGVFVADGTFTMNGGSISNNTAKEGGGVKNNGSAVFIMDSGNISQNTAEYGGGVYFQGDRNRFTINGGTITGNTATGAGGGVCIWTDGSVKFSGSPIISGNFKNGTLNETTGLYELGESGSINNIYIHGESGVITVTGELVSGASVGVTKMLPSDETPLTIAIGSNYTITESDAAKFFSDGGFAIILDSDNNVMQMKEASLDTTLVDEPAVDEMPTDDAAQSGNAGLWIGIGIVALAAIVVVLAVAVARKKRKENE